MVVGYQSHIGKSRIFIGMKAPLIDPHVPLPPPVGTYWGTRLTRSVCFSEVNQIDLLAHGSFEYVVARRVDGGGHTDHARSDQAIVGLVNQTAD